jgi:hypothetical protein
MTKLQLKKMSKLQEIVQPKQLKPRTEFTGYS